MTAAVPPHGLRLHIIRHGDPIYETDSLTDRGRAEAEALALRADELAPDRLFVSPMGRARATAAPLEAALGMVASIEAWAAELSSPLLPDGDGGSHVFWNVSGRYVAQMGSTPWQEWPIFVGHVPQIESELNRTIQGGRGFLARLGYHRGDLGYERQPDAVEDLSVAIVCHGGLGAIWLSDLLGIPLTTAWTSLFLPVTSVTTVLFESRGDSRIHTPRALRIGDTSHLFAAGLGTNWQGLPGARRLSPRTA